MDAIELIMKDHDRVEELFARFKGGGGLTGLVRRVTGNVPARERRTAVEHICRELDVHTRVEEEILYPAAQATADTEVQRLVAESLAEHTRVKEHVAWLREHHAEASDEDIDARMSALEQDVQHHVSEEENDMLPRLQELLSESDLASLGRRIQARKRALGERRVARTQRGAPRKRRATGSQRGRKTAARTRESGARKTSARATSKRNKKARAR